MRFYIITKNDVGKTGLNSEAWINSHRLHPTGFVTYGLQTETLNTDSFPENNFQALRESCLCSLGRV